jgi:hypothetical protein
MELGKKLLISVDLPPDRLVSDFIGAHIAPILNLLLSTKYRLPFFHQMHHLKEEKK